eukprot:g12194.t1
MQLLGGEAACPARCRFRWPPKEALRLSCHDAAKTCSTEPAKLLIQRQSEHNVRDKQMTALMYAANQGNLEFAKLLVEPKTDFSVTDKEANVYTRTALNSRPRRPLDPASIHQLVWIPDSREKYQCPIHCSRREINHLGGLLGFRTTRKVINTKSKIIPVAALH